MADTIITQTITKSGINVKAPYNERFIRMIKNIPFNHRMWNSETKEWFVSFEWQTELNLAIKDCFDNPVCKVIKNYY